MKDALVLLDDTHMHPSVVQLMENMEAGNDVAEYMTDFLPKLIGTVFFQNRDGFRGQANSPGLTGLGWSDISALFLCVQKCLPDHHNAFVQVNAVPL